MKLLLLCPIGIGNYLLAYPTFRAIKNVLPEAKLYLVALRESLGPVARSDPMFERTLIVEPAQMASLRQKLNWIREVRSLQCDTAISFFPSNRLEYNLLIFFCGARTRIAFRYKLKRIRSAGFLANRRIDALDGLHDVKQNLRVLEALGTKLDGPLVFPNLFDCEDLNAAASWLEQKGLSSRNLIGMHPGSSAEHGMVAKRWPEMHFGELAKQLARQYDSVVLVFGGPEENTIKRTVALSSGHTAVSVEGLSIRQTAALISKCRFFVSNDSGLMHMAALSNVPTAGIFGPTDDTRTAPWGKGHLVMRNSACGPCWTIANVGVRQHCRYEDYRCIKDLSVEEVFQKICEWRK